MDTGTLQLRHMDKEKFQLGHTSSSWTIYTPHEIQQKIKSLAANYLCDMFPMRLRLVTWYFFVWLHTNKSIATRINLKLSPCFYGSFRIRSMIEPMAYELELPSSHVLTLFFMFLSWKQSRDPTFFLLLGMHPFLKI